MQEHSEHLKLPNSIIKIKEYTKVCFFIDLKTKNIIITMPIEYFIF